MRPDISRIISCIIVEFPVICSDVACILETSPPSTESSVKTKRLLKRVSNCNDFMSSAIIVLRKLRMADEHFNATWWFSHRQRAAPVRCSWQGIDRSLVAPTKAVKSKYRCTSNAFWLFTFKCFYYIKLQNMLNNRLNSLITKCTVIKNNNVFLYMP